MIHNLFWVLNPMFLFILVKINLHLLGCPYDRVNYELIILCEHVAHEPMARLFTLCLLRTWWRTLSAWLTTWWPTLETGCRRCTETLWVYLCSDVFFLLSFGCFHEFSCYIVCVCVFQENMSTDSHSHSFSSSSVMTYSKVGNEPPKVFQASSSTLRAPGGVSIPAHLPVAMGDNGWMIPFTV